MRCLATGVCLHWPDRCSPNRTGNKVNRYSARRAVRSSYICVSHTPPCVISHNYCLIKQHTGDRLMYGVCVPYLG